MNDCRTYPIVEKKLRTKQIANMAKEELSGDYNDNGIEKIKGT